MSRFFRIFQHLFPRSHAWRIVIDLMLRKFLEGLKDFQETYVLFVDQIFEDLDPTLTRELSSWEDQFQLSGSGTENERRQSLDAAWKAQGGQSPGYLQNILRTAGFDVFVHEWWFFDGPTRKTRNPQVYLSTTENSAATFGEPEAVFGEPDAVFGGLTAAVGDVLVNKGLGISYLQATPAAAFGEPEAVFGEPDAVFGETGALIFVPKIYPIPIDPTKYPFFVYVGGEIFPDVADVPEVRRIELERMVLKYFPDQLWVGMLINYI